MKSTHRRSVQPDKRRGFQVLELLFVLPVLALLLIAAMAYGGTLIVRSAVAHAATAGAREAGKGGDVQDVVGAINGVLAVHDMAISAAPGSGTKVVVQDGQGGTQEYGDPGLIAVPPCSLAADEVRVLIWINTDAKKIDGLRPVVPCVSVLGSSLLGGRLCVQSLVKKEEVRAGRVCRSDSGGTASHP